MRFLDLFSGIGGFSYGLEMAGMECVGQVEINKDCLKILEKHWPNVLRFKDIKDVRGDEFGRLDLVCAGVPCQPASSAGKRKGTKDERWLWDEALRVICQAKPTWCLFENVQGLASVEEGLAFEGILVQLERSGYSVQPFIIPACALGARHRRDRIWILAHAEYDGLNGSQEPGSSESRIETQTGSGRTQQSERPSSGSLWDENLAWSSSRSNTNGVPESRSQPRMGRMVDGIPSWLDEGFLERMTELTKESSKRLKALGNAIVPQIVMLLGHIILAVERGEKAPPITVVTNLFDEG